MSGAPLAAGQLLQAGAVRGIEQRAGGQVTQQGDRGQHAGQRLAFVEAAPGASFAVDELRDLCRAHLASYKIPSEFHVVAALPRGPLGKVSRAAVERLSPGDGRA